MTDKYEREGPAARKLLLEYDQRRAMNSLGHVIEKIPTLWKAAGTIVAAVVLGFAIRGFMDSQVGLPARVSAVEVMVRDSAMPRLRVLEGVARDNRGLIAQRDLQLDSIARFARQTCLAVMESIGKSYRECE